MAPLPKRRHSTKRGGTRQAAWKKAFTQLHGAGAGFTACTNCGAMRLPHRACSACGWYDGKVAVVKKEKKKK